MANDYNSNPGPGVLAGQITTHSDKLVKVTEVPQEIDNLERVTSILWGELEQLTGKLSTVLRNEPRDDSSSEESVFGYSSDLANVLHNRTDSIRRAADHLRDLNNRIEL